MHKQTSKFLIGMASGALVGTTLALFLAPKSGKGTRRALGSKAGHLAASIRQRRVKQDG